MASTPHRARHSGPAYVVHEPEDGTESASVRSSSIDGSEQMRFSMENMEVYLKSLQKDRCAAPAAPAESSASRYARGVLRLGNLRSAVRITPLSVVRAVVKCGACTPSASNGGGLTTVFNNRAQMACAAGQIRSKARLGAMGYFSTPGLLFRATRVLPAVHRPFTLETHAGISSGTRCSGSKTG